MSKLLAVCFIAMLAGLAISASAQQEQALRLVQTIPLPGVKGRLDHMGIDLEKKRLFVAAATNNCPKGFSHLSRISPGRAVSFSAGR